MSIERYRTHYEHTSPKGVNVRITRDGHGIFTTQVLREVVTPGRGGALESIREMMERARDGARKWIRDDREARRLEREFNAEDVRERA
jgi:hypothetical protein